MLRLATVFSLCTSAAAAVPGVAGAACTHISADGYTFDLSPMERITGDKDFTKSVEIGQTIQFVYRLNICHDTIMPCQNQQGAVTESLRIPAGETCRVLGRTGDFKTEDMKFPVSNDNPHGEGVRIVYSGGDICDPATRSTRMAAVEIQCSVSGTGAGELTEMEKSDSCKTTFQMKSRHACSVSSLSYGTVFLIIFFLGFSLYCIGGSLMNWKMHGKRGIEMIPHYQFWTQLPETVKDGCELTKAKLFGKGQGYSQGSTEEEDYEC